MNPRSFTILALILCFSSWQTMALDSSTVDTHKKTLLTRSEQPLHLRTQPIDSTNAVKVDIPADDARYGIHGDVLKTPTEYLI
mmetsp:Transcript_45825/g.111057  ORF Transcript_45825/g.111057 Transcript_45825/m.111057 type:complete len:83 (+) Transcript_45825:129-377(+)